MENRRPLGLGSATTKTPSRRSALNHKNTLNDKNTSYYSKNTDDYSENKSSSKSTKKYKNSNNAKNPSPFDFDFAPSDEDGDSEEEEEEDGKEDESGEERGEEWENAYSRVLNPNTSTKSTHSPTKSARTTSANTSPSKHSKTPTGKSTSTTKRVDFAALARQRQRRSTGGVGEGAGAGGTPRPSQIQNHSHTQSQTRPRPSVSASEALFDFPRYAHLGQDDDGMDVDRDFGAGAEERGKQGESETAREIHGVQQRLQLISPPPEEVIVRSRSARLSGQFTPAKAGLLVGTGANPNNANNSVGSNDASASAKGTKSTQEVKGAKRKRPRPSQPRARVSVEAGVDAAQVEGEGEQAEEEGETHEAEPEEQVEATPNPKPRKVARGRALGRGRVNVDLEESPTRGSRGRGVRAEEGEEEEGEMDVDVEGAEDYVMRSVGKRKGGEKESQRGGGEREEKENATPTRARRVLVQSPYARNPDADWIAPLSLSAVEGPARRAVLGARSARRSMTPIPHYEPPPDVFTPPRVVFATPVPRKTTTRTPSGKGRSKSERKPRTGLRVVTTPVAVKQEIPDDIDLSAPMPPPSPTDDPLLLSGPPSEGNSSSPARMRVDGRRFRVPEVPVRRVREASVQAEAEEAHIPIAEEFAPLQDQDDDDDGVLPPSSPERPLDESMGTEDSMMRVDPADAEVSPVRLFEGGGWSDSEEERTPARPPMELMEEGEGEYTGRWRMLRVRTKQDPPSSATKMRMDAWGRPVSPFPKHLRIKKLDLRPIQHEDEDAPMQGAAELDQDAPLNNDSEDDDDASSDTDFDPSLVKITSADPRAAARAAAILKQHDYDCYTKMVLKKRVADAKARRATLAGSGADLARESRRRDLASAGIAKTSSSNHTAATTHAKGRRTTLAAGMGVIGEQVFIPGSPVVTLPQLLQDAEVEVRNEMNGPQSPAKVWAARAAVEGRDAYKTPAPRRSLPFTLPSVTNARPFSPASKHTPASATCSPFHLAFLSTDITANGERKWSKDAWRALDACFTDLRLEHGAAAAREQERDDGGAEMAPVDAVRIEDVVDRFLDLVRESAGDAQEVDVDMDKWGGAWSRDTLTERARALVKKQREGRGARPLTPLTTPRVSLSDTPVAMGAGKAFDFSFATPAPRSQDAVSEEDTTPELRIEVPDFTPLPMGRRGVAHPRARALSRKASASRAEEVSDAVEMEVASSVARQRQSPRPPPVAPRAPFAALSVDEEDQRRASAPRLSLLKAPRYSHLLEEAVRVSLGVPEPTNREQEGGDGQEEGESFEGEESFEDSYGQESFEDEQEVEDEQDDANTTTTAPENANATLGTRVKGFLFSYLRPSSKAASSSSSSALPQRKPTQPRKPGLPLPPRAILDKPRGPVRTPARLPVVRPVPPRELVRLHPAPSSTSTSTSNKSAIPRRAPPKRLVELHHAPPPVEQPLVKLGGTMPRPRRSSGSSVRDLVKGFEALDREQKGVMEGVKRMRSVGELRKEWRAAGGDTRPRWKF